MGFFERVKAIFKLLIYFSFLIKASYYAVVLKTSLFTIERLF